MVEYLVYFLMIKDGKGPFFTIQSNSQVPTLITSDPCKFKDQFSNFSHIRLYWQSIQKRT